MLSLLHVKRLCSLLALLCWIPIAFLIFNEAQRIAGIGPYKECILPVANDVEPLAQGKEDSNCFFSVSQVYEISESGSDNSIAFHELKLEERITIVIFGLPPIFILIFSFFMIRKLFKTYANGEFFSVGTARYMKLFSIGIILHQLVQPYFSDLSARVSYYIKTGKSLGQWSYSITTDGMFIIFLAVLLLLIAWVMAEAARFAEDSRSII